MATFSPPRNVYSDTIGGLGPQLQALREFYTQHDVEEAARGERNFEQYQNLRLLMEQRQRDAEDAAAQRLYADRLQARNYRVDARRDARDYRTQQEALAENMRRYRSAQGIAEGERAEEKRRFGITSEIARKTAESRYLGYDQPTAAETTEDALNYLNGLLAEQQIKQRAEFQQQIGNRQMTADEEAKTRIITAQTAEQLRRLAQARIGTIPPAVRFDAPSMTWRLGTDTAVETPFVRNPALSGSNTELDYRVGTRRVTPRGLGGTLTPSGGFTPPEPSYTPTFDLGDQPDLGPPPSSRTNTRTQPAYIPGFDLGAQPDLGPPTSTRTNTRSLAPSVIPQGRGFRRPPSSTPTAPAPAAPSAWEDEFEKASWEDEFER